MGSGPPVGLTITEVRWPPTSHLLALRRDEHTIAVAATTVLVAGDRLTVLVAAAHSQTVAESLQRSRRLSPGG